MTASEDFKKADKAVHPVESQWHYPIMTKHGWTPVTPEAVGFVRSYDYTHPVNRGSITVTTGYSSDYWKDNNPKDGAYHGGFWSDLEPYLREVK
jgi:hypothetical protein